MNRLLAPPSYRRRVQLLLVGSLLFGGFAFHMAVRPTLALWHQNRAQRLALQELAQAPRATAALQAEQQRNQWLIRAFQADTAQSEGRALRLLAGTCRRYRVTVAALSPGQQSQQAGCRLETRVVKLRGAFHGLLQATHELEYRRPIGRLSSVRFALEEDRKQRRSYLYAYLHVQTIVQLRNAH